MRKFIILTLATLFLTAALSSCKTFKNVVCPIVTQTVCPILENLLGLGLAVTIKPTEYPHKVLVSAKGITGIVCDLAGGICASVDSVLATGKPVTIQAVPYSTNKVNGKNGVVYIQMK